MEAKAKAKVARSICRPLAVKKNVHSREGQENGLAALPRLLDLVMIFSGTRHSRHETGSHTCNSPVF